MKTYNIGPRLSRFELIGGFCFLPVYVFVLSWLLGWLSRATGLNLTQATLNLIFYYVSFAVVVVLFHRILAESLKAIPHSFWPFIQAMILGFALYYAATLLLGLGLGWVWPGLENPADTNTIGLVRSSGRIMLVCAIFLGPLVEETLIRGLVFGSLQPANRILAYAVSALVYAALHLWPYVGSFDTAMLLGDILLYVPAALALGWTYEKAGNLWAPILLHMFINALSLGAIQLVY